MVTKIDPGQLYIVEPQRLDEQKTRVRVITRLVSETTVRQRTVSRNFKQGTQTNVVPFKVFETEAPMFIENMLHAEFAANQVGVEWFKFDSSTLKKVVDRTRCFEERIRSKIQNPSPKILGDYQTRTRVVGSNRNEGRKNQRRCVQTLFEFLMKTAEHQRNQLSSDHEFGIRGVTDVLPPSSEK